LYLEACCKLVGIAAQDRHRDAVGSDDLTGMTNKPLLNVTNTIKNFEDSFERDMHLRDCDIFFIDIGPVCDTEGDGGETFVIGTNPDPDMKRCAEDVKEILRIVRDKWMSTGMNGKELYDFAYKTTAGLGWVLNMELTGHCLSEFPHSAYYDGTLAAVSIAPRRTCGCSKSRFAIQQTDWWVLRGPAAYLRGLIDQTVRPRRGLTVVPPPRTCIHVKVMRDA
jgi:hypothetical protein